MALLYKPTDTRGLYECEAPSDADEVGWDEAERLRGLERIRLRVACLSPAQLAECRLQRLDGDIAEFYKREPNGPDLTAMDVYRLRHERFSGYPLMAARCQGSAYYKRIALERRSKRRKTLQAVKTVLKVLVIAVCIWLFVLVSLTAFPGGH